MGSPKASLGSPTISLFLYKCNRLRRERGFFPPSNTERHIVRRTISFCNKKLQFAGWRKRLWNFLMLYNGWQKDELLYFSACVHESWDRSNFMTDVLLNDFWFTFVESSPRVMYVDYITISYLIVRIFSHSCVVKMNISYL